MYAKSIHGYSYDYENQNFNLTEQKNVIHVRQITRYATEPIF